MHVYIYDSRLENTKYHSILAKIETRLTDLGLNGRIVRLNPMHNLERTIRDELKQSCTIVLVGNDDLINSAISILANHEAVVGIIPIGKENNSIAESLGISPEVAACDALAARRIINTDLGIANGSVFLNQLYIKTNHALIDIDDNLSLEIEAQTEIIISNFNSIAQTEENISDPEDGLLELVINTLVKKPLFAKAEMSHSYLQKNNFLINGEFEAILDNCTNLKAPITISVAKNALKIIIDRKRGV